MLKLILNLLQCGNYAKVEKEDIIVPGDIYKIYFKHGGEVRIRHNHTIFNHKEYIDIYLFIPDNDAAVKYYRIFNGDECFQEAKNIYNKIKNE